MPGIYVLLTLNAFYGNIGGSVIATQEFSSKEACERAMVWITETNITIGRAGQKYTYTTCVPK